MGWVGCGEYDETTNSHCKSECADPDSAHPAASSWPPLDLALLPPNTIKCLPKVRARIAVPTKAKRTINPNKRSNTSYEPFPREREASGCPTAAPFVDSSRACRITTVPAASAPVLRKPAPPPAIAPSVRLPSAQHAALVLPDTTIPPALFSRPPPKNPTAYPAPRSSQLTSVDRPAAKTTTERRRETSRTKRRGKEKKPTQHPKAGAPSTVGSGCGNGEMDGGGLILTMVPFSRGSAALVQGVSGGSSQGPGLPQSKRTRWWPLLSLLMHSRRLGKRGQALFEMCGPLWKYKMDRAISANAILLICRVPRG
ncbi:hypothetical protein BDK51DRAFT_46835 [Blyttiomyces helicus]|uniref:Uncharacterized protein n=1 Tax=Blyttiomyces helicus TaxID=388810 RepID=A0A4P9W180_9FUNG|nr:hypothetical protein BDK51DRAFT_46835 [Blyttiomyces helicus]|eukprot:RKO83816.1 hypothetical protein BDK51DRAFT_46835 [Blyttiomyces helicus]